MIDFTRLDEAVAAICAGDSRCTTRTERLIRSEIYAALAEVKDQAEAEKALDKGGENPMIQT